MAGLEFNLMKSVLDYKASGMLTPAGISIVLNSNMEIKKILGLL